MKCKRLNGVRRRQEERLGQPPPQDAITPVMSLAVGEVVVLGLVLLHRMALRLQFACCAVGSANNIAHRGLVPSIV